jgi:tetratricopeptide (TPR) repeat protein
MLTILPPNPFAREAVSNREMLVGRKDELDSITYYLKLTSAGQSPHIALVGERGVGKTSLLNASEQIAADNGLVVARLDLDEDKTRSPGRFWFSFYSAVVQKVFNEGSWQGRSGPIYASIFRALYAKQIPEPDMAVLMVPVQFAAHAGALDEFVIDHSLLVNDFRAILENLRTLQRTGLVILIDEADTLRANPPILQELRNLCQSIRPLTLMLAGTNKVFPLITDAFSPIPRQFFKVEIKAFSHWSTTYELIVDSLPNIPELQPSTATAVELHNLTAGDPSELKLFCHHIYRAMEDGETKEFALTPLAIRRVLNEFKAGATGPASEAITKIHKLQDSELLDSPWLGFRSMSAYEAAKVSLFRAEITRGKALTEPQREDVVAVAVNTYQKLHDLGITLGPDRLDLIGDPVASAYWKALAQSKGRELNWLFLGFEEMMHMQLGLFLAGEGEHALIVGTPDGPFESRSILTLREGLPAVKAESSDVQHLLEAAIRGRANDVWHATDIHIRSTIGTSTGWQRITFVSDSKEEAFVAAIKDAGEKVREILMEYGMAYDMDRVVRWELPSNEEMHRLGRVSGVHVPEKWFGPSLLAQAVKLYCEGDEQSCLIMLERLLAEHDDPGIRNNIAFIQILRGNYEIAEEYLDKALSVSREALYIHNLAVLSALTGSQNEAVQYLKQALSDVTGSSSQDEMAAMLILDESLSTVADVRDISIKAGCLLNLVRLDALSMEEALQELQCLNPDRDWASLINAT